MPAADVLADVYRPLLAFADTIDEPRGWTPTHLPGWTARDLLFHLAGDAQRALVALATLSNDPPDTDAISYWSAWKPGDDPTQAGLRGVRISASAWSSVRGPAEMFAETARAVLTVARATDPAAVVRTQGHRLTVDSLLRTLAVEATVHHLDLEPAHPGAPSEIGLVEVRRVLDGLLGEPAPSHWDTIRYARIGTGRLPADATELRELGPSAARLPLFG